MTISPRSRHERGSPRSMKMELVLRRAPAHNILWNRAHFLSRTRRTLQNSNCPPWWIIISQTRSYHSRTCRTGRRRHDLAVLDDGADRVRSDANQIDCRAVDNDRIHLSARFEAADAIVAIDGGRRVDRR